MHRVIVVVALCAVAAAVAAAPPDPPPCGEQCRAAIVETGGAVDVTGVDKPFKTTTRKLTLHVSNRTTLPVSVMLANFQLMKDGKPEKPQCPGELSLGTVPNVSGTSAEACRSQLGLIQPGKSRPFSVIAKEGNTREHYKFDIVVKREGKPDFVKDPEIIIDQTSSVRVPTRGTK